MATIYVEDKPYDIPDGQNLLAACLALGFDLPFFCWHPAMGSVGACRQCAVKQFRDENDREGRIVMACVTPAADGTRISIDDPEARAFRAGVIEWLMAGHPHDCPVCDEGGECHLQDMTVMTGHWRRRYRYPKRTFRNQDLGPFIAHEMNRCIQCYRCVRFYADYAGGDDLVAMGIRNHVYFGRHKEGRLESEFSGNLVEVCPTGVFTDRTFARHYTRKWDLQTAPSVCPHCGLGCNTIPGERYGILRRVHSRYNGAVNGYFICDRGRFGYEFVNAESRLRTIKVSGRATTPEEAILRVGDLIAAARIGLRRVIGIASPRASLEANWALRKLVGPENFFIGMAGQERRLVDLARKIIDEGPSRSCSTRDLEEADAMLILGEDVTNTAPMLDYSLRQWIRRRPTPEQIALKIPSWNDAAVGELIRESPTALHILSVRETKLDRLAVQTYHAAPSDLARLAFAVAHLLDQDVPAVPDLPQELAEHAALIAAEFAEAKRPIVVSGTSSGSEDILRAAANVAWSLHTRGAVAELALVMPECNSLGMSLMGGGTFEDALEAASRGEVDVAIVLENDLYRRAPSAEVDRFLQACGRVVVLDHTDSGTSRAADILLPVATYAESTGIFVNNEGRAQRYYQVLPTSGQVHSSLRWLANLAAALVAHSSLARTPAQELPASPAAWLVDWPSAAAEDAPPVSFGAGGGESWPGPAGLFYPRLIDQLTTEMASELPVFAPLLEVAPPATYRVAGMEIARQSQRFSGRTAMHADETVFEPKPLDDPQSPLVFSMEGYQGAPPSPIIPRFWAPGWNSGQAINKMQPGPDRPLPGGDVGVRLIEPTENLFTPHFLELPMAFMPSGVEDLVVPVHHIFGSEEMSNHAPGVAESAPAPYVGLNPADAEAFELNDGDLANIETYGVSLSLPVKVMPILVPGVAVLPVGLPGLEGVLPPFYARIEPASGKSGERPDPARIREAAAVARGPDAGTTAARTEAQTAAPAGERGPMPLAPGAKVAEAPGTEAGDVIE
jgi:NADH-quinone oxidoreductase subunit G